MHGFVSGLRDRDHSGIHRLHAQGDVRLSVLVFQALSLGFNIDRSAAHTRLFHDEGRFCLASVRARLAKVDRISRLANDAVRLDLTLVQQVLPNHIVGLALRGGRLARATVMQADAALLHTIPSFFLYIRIVVLQSLYRWSLVHKGCV